MPNTLIMISYGNAECAVEILLLLTCIVHADEVAIEHVDMSTV